MIIDDELFNMYLNGELDGAAKEKIETELSKSPELKRKYLTLMKVHKELKNIREYEISSDFTNKLLARLTYRRSADRSQKTFIAVVLSIFFVTISLVLSFILTNLPKERVAPLTDTNWHKIINSYTLVTLNFVSELLSGKYVTIIGSLISFCVLIAAYLFFEKQRSLKTP